MNRPKPQYDEIHLEFYDKQEMDDYLQYLENKHHEMILRDVKTNKEWRLNFIFVAFPGLQHSGYRVEGFHQTGKTRDGYNEGELHEFGTWIIEDKKMKLIQW